MIKKWAENECKQDASLGLIETLYKNLLAEGHSFETDSPPKFAVCLSVIAVLIVIIIY